MRNIQTVQLLQERKHSRDETICGNTVVSAITLLLCSNCCGNYLRAETVQGRKLFAGIQYLNSPSPCAKLQLRKKGHHWYRSSQFWHRVVLQLEQNQSKYELRRVSHHFLKMLHLYSPYNLDNNNSLVLTVSRSLRLPEGGLCFKNWVK